MKKNKENRLVVGDMGWAETIPEWLLEEVKSERMICGLGSLINPDCLKVGDAEVCVYLYTAGLHAPLSRDDTNIYVYLTSKLMKKKNKELPQEFEEVLKSGLKDYEERELKELRDTIYKVRGGEISHPLLDAMRIFKKGLSTT